MPEYIIEFEDQKFLVTAVTHEELLNKISDKLHKTSGFDFTKNTLKLEIYHSLLKCYYDFNELPAQSSLIRASYSQDALR